MRQVVIYSDEEGVWIAECLSLPGCVSRGKSREAAISNMKEAIKFYIETFERDGLPIPEERFNAALVSL